MWVIHLPVQTRASISERRRGARRELIARDVIYALGSDRMQSTNAPQKKVMAFRQTLRLFKMRSKAKARVKARKQITVLAP